MFLVLLFFCVRVLMSREIFVRVRVWVFRCGGVVLSLLQEGVDFLQVEDGR